MGTVYVKLLHWDWRWDSCGEACSKSKSWVSFGRIIEFNNKLLFRTGNRVTKTIECVFTYIFSSFTFKIFFLTDGNIGKNLSEEPNVFRAFRWNLRGYLCNFGVFREISCWQGTIILRSYSASSEEIYLSNIQNSMWVSKM